ncbi:MAG: sugar ABC transporter permease [Methylobacteriaceae bacterium]|nr:sugar ABC transporter permease [Methylobacteriaceae bacterium]
MLASFGARRQVFFALLGLPALAYVAVVAIWPLLQGLWYSFFHYNLVRPGQFRFIGLSNYIDLFTDDTTRWSVIVTFIFTVLAVSIEFVLGLGLAVLLWRDNRFNRIALALLLVPVTVTPLAVGLLFRALLAPDFGLLGYYAAQLGLSGERGFFADPVGAMGAIVFIDVWQWTPLMALILLAGLKALPVDVIDAAETDGATALQRFRIIVFPMILPSVFLSLVLRTMDAFRVFDSVFVTTKGGPNDATNVLLFYAVKQGFEFYDIGFASAIANLMIVCMAIFAVVFILLIRRADRMANG